MSARSDTSAPETLVSKVERTNTILTIPEPGRIELVDRPFPTIKSGYVIIQNAIAPICLEGTRIWAEHNFEFHDDPTHLGHESVGTVVEVVDGSHYAVGDRVVVFQGDHCGQCHSCRNGLSPTYCDANLPDHGGEALIGLEKRNESSSGGFAMAQYRIAPEANIYKLPDSVSFRHAAAANCSFGVGFSNQELMGVTAGDTVLMGGIGFITMGHVISALYRNATVIALIRNAYRKSLLEEMGVQHFVNPDDDDWIDQVRALTYEGQGADHSVDGSGVTYYQERLMQATRRYGTVNFSGHTPGARLDLSPLDHVIDPAHTLVGQHDVQARDRERLIRALTDNNVQRMIDVMVTHEFPMSEADKAFEVQVNKRCGKIYLYPQE